MAKKNCSPTARICAMCEHWNGNKGGIHVQPRVGMRNVMEYDSEETQICYKRSFNMKAWNSCSEWLKKYG